MTNNGSVNTTHAGQAQPSTAADAAHDSGDIGQRIVEFMRDYSIEITPHDRDKIDEFTDYLIPGMSVYVANPPRVDHDDVIETARRLRVAGYHAIPHLLARELVDDGELRNILETMRSARIDQLLLIAGDVHEATGPFESTLDVMETGLLEEFGFDRFGVAGHPEGSPVIGQILLGNALAEKNAYAKRVGATLHIVSQMSFDADSVVAWARQISRNGNQLPIHLGIAGPTRLRTLLRYGARCGIGASMRTLTKKASALANVVRVAAPDELITSFARYQTAAPQLGLAKAHFFTFGGVERTARWLNAVSHGQFELRPDGRGFVV